MTSTAPQVDIVDSTRHARQPVEAWIEEAWSRPGEPRTTEVDGASVAFLGWSLDRRDLPGLVFAHGFQAHARWWDHIAPWFADRFRVIAVDFSGFGDSDHRRAYSRRQHGRELLDAAASAGIERPTVVAHSYGALATLAACHHMPERVGRAILIEAWLGVLDGGVVEMPTSGNRTYPDLATALGRYRLAPPGGWPEPMLVEHVARQSLRRTDDGAGWRFKFDGRAPESLNDDGPTEVYRDTTVPLAYVHGDRSDVVDAADIARCQALLATCAPPIAVPMAHHHVMLEAPTTLVAVLSALLGSPPR